jgi:hypothetical protein
MKDLKRVQNRRQMLIGALRYGALGFLGAIGGSFIAKRRRLVREGKCINGGICRECEIFDDCSLPTALSAKDVLARINNGGK